MLELCDVGGERRDGALLFPDNGREQGDDVHRADPVTSRLGDDVGNVFGDEPEATGTARVVRCIGS